MVYAAVYGSNLVTSASFKIAAQRVADNAGSGHVVVLGKSRRRVYAVSRGSGLAKLMRGPEAEAIAESAADRVAADPLA